MRNIEKLSQPIYIVKGLSDDYYHVTTDNTVDGTDVLFSSDNGIELLSFVSGYKSMLKSRLTKINWKI